MSLKGSTFGVRPYVDADLQTLEIRGGVSLDILDTLASYYGFTYDVKYAYDWLRINQDGSVGGALGEVM